jgi:TonB family protein
MTAATIAANILSWTAQTTVVIGAGLLVLALLRVTTPGVRYVFLRLLLATSLALPFAQPWLHPVVGFDLPPPPPPGGVAERERGARRPSDPVEPRSTIPVNPFGELAPWLLLLLLSGAAGRAAWMTAGVIRLRRLRAAGMTAPDSAEHDELQDLIGARANIRQVEGLGQPVTFGVRNPVVLLPDALLDLPAGIQRAVLAHELWHVRRRDWLWVVIEELLRAAFWFNPALWTLINRIQATREEVVDDLTILLTGSRRNYLDALVAFADRPCLFAATAFARRRHLVRRILLISKESVMSSKRVVATAAAMLAIVLGTSWYAVAAFPLAGAPQQPRDRMPPPPPPAPSQFELKKAEFLKKVQEQPNAANYTTLATLYWERAFRDFRISGEEKSKLIADAIGATDQALAYDADYVPALTYKNILLRMQAQTADPTQRDALLAEADSLRARAMELAKKQPRAIPGEVPRDAPPPPPPPPPPPGFAQDVLVDGEVPLRVGGNIKTPFKIKDVRPVYPPEAQSARVMGVVIIEAVIDAEGRVRNARVLRSIPLLDQAALDAVRQWEFEPVQLNGVPKPVIMTVTVNFTLQ